MNTQHGRIDGELGFGGRARVLLATLVLALLATVFAASVQPPDVSTRVVEETDTDKPSE